MPLTEKKKASNEKYFKENWKQVKLSMPKEEAEALDNFCAENGYTRAGLIRILVREFINKENNDDSPP